MTFINPDLDWYTDISKREGVSPRCPFANVHRCPRYYYSLNLLGNAGTTTKIKPEKIQELDSLWDKTDILPVVAEHDTGITSYDEKVSSYSNFCPEISFDIFGLFASYLHRYGDEFEREYTHEQLKTDKHPNDWRWNWAHVSPLHYLKCPVYSQLLSRQSNLYQELPKSELDDEMLELKPGIAGFTINIKVLLTRLARWWLKQLSSK